MVETESIRYPHIRGAGVIIPDCSRGIYTPFRLTSREKRALVRKLAERGLSGIDDFINESREEGIVHDRLDEIRKRMKDELEKIRSRRRGALDDQIRHLSQQGGIADRESDDGLLDDSGFRRFASDEIRGDILASDLIMILEGNEVVEDYVEKEGLFKRIWNAIKRFFRGIISFFIRIYNRMRAKTLKNGEVKEKGRKKKGAIALPFPSLQKDMDSWERKMDRKIEMDEGLQKAVNRRISDRYGYTSGRIELERNADPEWYREEARKILREEVEKTARESEKRIEKKKNEVRQKKRRMDEDAIARKERIMGLKRGFETEMMKKEKEIETLSKEEMKNQLIGSLSSMGYLKKLKFGDGLENTEEEWEITEALVEKFSELIYAEVSEKRKGMIDRRGRQVSDAGVYEKARPRMVSEESRMDILESMVNARIRHPGDRTIDHDDMMILREVTTSELHGVIIMDISGSMDENMRIDAAKRSVLALTQAIKRENPRNRVDIISLSTRAKPISLKEVMAIEPKGFTNHQEAISMARSILASSRADKKILFMITDGLPEAYINEEGEPVAGDFDTAMRKALIESSALLRLKDLTFDIFLLEPENEDFINSAKMIAKEGGGKIIVADPNKLAYQVMGTYEKSSLVLEGV